MNLEENDMSEQEEKNGSYRLTISLKKEDYDALRKMGYELDRSLSWVTQKAVRELYERHSLNA
jgi:hypothetical protein